MPKGKKGGGNIAENRGKEKQEENGEENREGKEGENRRRNKL